MSPSAGAARFSRGRSALFASVLILGFFGLSEGVLRLVGVERPARPRILLRSMDMDVSFPFMQPDPELFWSMRPGWSGEFQGKRVTINSLGLRGAEPRLPKPIGQRRVVCFGDSISFGFALADGDSYPARLESLLAPRGVDVVNAGTTGYTSHQVLGLLRRVGPGLQADVGLFLVGWNDGNERAMNDRDYGRRIASELALEEALDHLYVYRAAKGLYLRAQARRVRRGGTAATAAVRQPDPTGRGARVPVAEYRENLGAIAAECRRLGMRPVFLPLPQRHRSGDARFETPYPAALAESARALGVPLLDLGPLAFGAGAEDNDADFIDVIHFSPTGTQRVAEAVARQLIALGLV